MRRRDGLAAIVAGGTANAVKLLVATLAFAGAYVGVEAAGTASSDAREAARQTGRVSPVRTVTLASRVLPHTAGTTGSTGSTGATRGGGDGGAAVRAGGTTKSLLGETTLSTLHVGVAAAARSCEKEIQVRGEIGNGDPSGTVLYAWRLSRWSPSAKTWKSYMTGGSGFTGPRTTVEWRPNVVNNPGWYLVELSVGGAGKVRSEKFQLSC